MGSEGLFLDCRWKFTGTKIFAIRLPRYPIRNLQLASLDDVSFVLANSNVKHALVDGQYNNLKRWCYEARDFCREQLEKPEKVSEQLGKPEKGEGDKEVGTGEFDFQLRDVSVDEYDSVTKKDSPAPEGLSEDARRRGRHIVEENSRVQQAMEAITAESREQSGSVRLGALMVASHESSRDLFGNSCAELDELVELARGCEGRLGVFGVWGRVARRGPPRSSTAF